MKGETKSANFLSGGKKCSTGGAEYRQRTSKHQWCFVCNQRSVLVRLLLPGLCSQLYIAPAALVVGLKKRENVRNEDDACGGSVHYYRKLKQRTASFNSALEPAGQEKNSFEFQERKKAGNVDLMNPCQDCEK